MGVKSPCSNSEFFLITLATRYKQWACMLKKCAIFCRAVIKISATWNWVKRLRAGLTERPEWHGCMQNGKYGYMKLRKIELQWNLGLNWSRQWLLTHVQALLSAESWRHAVLLIRSSITDVRDYPDDTRPRWFGSQAWTQHLTFHWYAKHSSMPTFGWYCSICR